MSIIDPTENRFAVIGIDVDKVEHWHSRWGLESSESEILNYYSPYLKFYGRIEVWVVDYKDNKLYSGADYIFENNKVEEKPDWLIEFEKDLK